MSGLLSPQFVWHGGELLRGGDDRHFNFAEQLVFVLQDNMRLLGGSQQYN
jgi:hypothetical protein